MTTRSKQTKVKYISSSYYQELEYCALGSWETEIIRCYFFFFAFSLRDREMANGNSFSNEVTSKQPVRREQVYFVLKYLQDRRMSVFCCCYWLWKSQRGTHTFVGCHFAIAICVVTIFHSRCGFNLCLFLSFNIFFFCSLFRVCALFISISRRWWSRTKSTSFPTIFTCCCCCTFFAQNFLSKLNALIPAQARLNTRKKLY